MKTHLLSVTLAALLAGCSTVTMMDGSEGPLSSNDCDVAVFQTQAQAAKLGPIDELCTIEGSSAPGFDHSVQAAIAKHKGKACGCGAAAVYVQSRSPATFSGPATVSLVAFRYIGASGRTSPGGQQPPPALPETNRQAPPVLAASDTERAKVAQVLSEQRFPLVGEPVRFKQKGSLTYYEARGAGGRLTQVVCETAGKCRVRTADD